MALFSHAPHSLCILRLSAIGDVCNAIAAVQSIQAHWPETKITWVTGKLEARLLEAIDGIEVIIFDKSLGWKAYTQLWKQLKHKRFDALLHMQYAMRANIANLGIKAQYKLGFDKTRSQDFQTWFTNQKVPSPPAPHVLDGFLAFANYLGVPHATPTWKLNISEQDTHWASTHLADNKPNLLVVPGASKAYKNWTAEGYAEVIRHAEQNGFHVIMAGSPSSVEIELAKNIAIRLQQPIENLVGQSSLSQMLALISQSQLVLAPDTGPTHMANALSIPVIGLYAHHNPKRTGPYNYQDYIVSVWQQAIEEQTDRPANSLSWRTRVKDKQAMQRIQTKHVIEMFDYVVKKEGIQ